MLHNKLQKISISILNKKNILFFLFIFSIFGGYIVYLNLYIFTLKDKIASKDELYKIQLNNRFNEITLLNDQLIDLQKILNIGLDLSKNDNVYLNTKLTEKDKRFILSSIPSGSPLEETFITSKYGYRIHPITKRRRLHTGVDFKAKVGTNIYSPADGIVVRARNNDPGGYGKMIKLVHNYGFKTLYAHMDDIYVKEGQVIQKGRVIGTTGNTGLSTGPHLHYEVKFAGNFVEPLDFVYWNKKTFNTIFTKGLSLDWEKLILLIKERRNDSQGK